MKKQKLRTLAFLIPFLLNAGGSLGCSRGNLINPNRLLSNNAATPVIEQVIPDTAQVSGGSKIAIFGKNFVEGAKVALGSLDCQNIQFVSSVTLICTTPAYLRPARVSVLVTNPNLRVAELKNGFTYTDPITPLQGATIVAGGGTLKSGRYASNIQVGFLGTSGAAAASSLQTSHSMTNLQGASAVRSSSSFR